MQSQTWQPVLPSHFLRAGDNIVAGFLQGQELALWRSAAGTVQAWENRCPHRGTRLTMGRIINDHLSCAYHGWEFDALANCVAIPANPDLPLPKQLRVRSFPVMEADGMVWVAPAGSELASQTAARDGASDAPSFCRSLSVRSSAARVGDGLVARGFKPVAGSHAWDGDLAGKPVSILLTEAMPQFTLVHVWLRGKHDHGDLSTVLADCKLIRRDVEAETFSRN